MRTKDIEIGKLYQIDPFVNIPRAVRSGDLDSVPRTRLWVGRALYGGVSRIYRTEHANTTQVTHAGETVWLSGTTYGNGPVDRDYRVRATPGFLSKVARVGDDYDGVHTGAHLLHTTVPARDVLRPWDRETAAKADARRAEVRTANRRAREARIALNREADDAKDDCLALMRELGTQVRWWDTYRAGADAIGIEWWDTYRAGADAIGIEWWDTYRAGADAIGIEWWDTYRAGADAIGIEWWDTYRAGADAIGIEWQSLRALLQAAKVSSTLTELRALPNAMDLADEYTKTLDRKASNR